MKMFSKKLDMWSKKKYKKKSFIKKIRNNIPNFINLELIMNKHDIGIGKRQLNIKNNNKIDPANTVYNCKILRNLIFSYFGKNHYTDIRYILDLDKSKEFNIILNRNKHMVFANNISSLYNGFFKKTYNEYDITKLPLYNIFTLGIINFYSKIHSKLSTQNILTIPFMKRFINKYDIHIHSNSIKYAYITEVINILIKNYSEYKRDSELNLKMIIRTFENQSNIYLNFDYVIDYSITIS